MIPIRDINPRVRTPVVNYALIFACAAAFVWELRSPHLPGLLANYGFIPAKLSAAVTARDFERIMTSLFAMQSSVFLHGGWLHIIGNLLYLRVFGDNIEDRLGHGRYFLFYLLAGTVGTLGQFFFDPTESRPLVGASGAIAGVLGAYIVLFPRAKILTLFPVFIFLTFIEVPAIVFLGFWGLQQFLNGYFSLGQSAGESIAWLAHISGFITGIVCGLVARKRRRR